MIKGKIILTFKNGKSYSYVNKELADKSGDDGADNLLHKGEPCNFYAYTGSGTDTYDDQTGTGKIKGDFDYFVNQIGEEGLLTFPEDSDTTELVRKTSYTDKPYYRLSIAASELVSVEVNEYWSTYPDSNNREAGYQLPKDSINFAGFKETDYITDRGPDFDKAKKFDDNYIPKPILELSGDNLVVVNENEYDSVVKQFVNDKWEVYGIKEGRKSATSWL